MELSFFFVRLSLLTVTSLPDVIFKNQAMNQKTPGQGNFVNDLLRTEFHRFVDTFSMYSQVLNELPFTENLWQNLSRYVHHFTSLTSLRS